jgi:hypothetical protein
MNNILGVISSTEGGRERGVEGGRKEWREGERMEGRVSRNQFLHDQEKAVYRKRLQLRKHRILNMWKKFQPHL